MNYYISGVNWSSLKKFARFIFGKENLITYQVTKDGKQFIIWVEKNFYRENKEAFDKFEDEFLVNMKPLG